MGCGKAVTKEIQVIPKLIPKLIPKSQSKPKQTQQRSVDVLDVDYYHNITHNKGRPIWEFALQQGKNGVAIELMKINNEPTFIFSPKLVCGYQQDHSYAHPLILA